MAGDYDSPSRVPFALYLLFFTAQRFLWKNYCDFARLRYLELEHLSSLFVQIEVEADIARIIVYFAYIDWGEIINKILPKHKKYSIISLFESEILFVCWRYFWPKLFILFWSPPGPLSFAPGVS